MRLRFCVLGLAQTAGSKRSFPFKRGDGSLGVRVTDDNPKTKSWQAQVANAASAAWFDVKPLDAELLSGPLLFKVTFYLPRPKGHFGAKGLRASAPAFPDVRPDLLKLTRAIEDALSKVIWRDDAQIVSEHLEKVYGEPARVEVTVETHWTAKEANGEAEKAEGLFDAALRK